MKFSIVNLGCKVNRVESDSTASALLSLGHTRAVSEQADLVVVNTCTVTEEAEKKTRKAVRRALSDNPHATVVVSGCASAMHPHEYEALDPRVRVVSRLKLETYLRERTNNASLVRLGESFNTRVNVKVQDGCDNDCTYCIVHVARGASRSMPFDSIVQESVALAKAGAREIVLAGINLGTYNDEGRSLSDLLEALLLQTESLPDDSAPVRFRIGSIEPQNVDDRLIGLLATSKGRVCRHLHLPLQSGSTKVLGEMNRHYTAEGFLALIDKLYAACPTLSLSTDIIVGFPGETDDEFDQTMDVARRCRFSKIHVFPYSRREGTPAACRIDQIAPEVKKKRAQALRTLGDEMRRSDFERRRGTIEAVLVEPGFALTESYHEIPRPPRTADGDLVHVELTSALQLLR